MGDDAELYMEMQEPGFWNCVESFYGQYVNNNLMKIYPSETVSLIYKTIYPLIRNLPGK